MGVKFWRSWRNFREFSKTPSWREFLKNCLKSNFLEKLLRDFPCKIEGEFNPRASLARAAFPLKFFFDPRFRPPTPVLVKVSEVSEVSE